ncbi:MAG: dihydropteroate synthase [Spirochaetales bacterium]|nr:dihydropteroate synthase [Spirochaetales bacterium]
MKVFGIVNITEDSFSDGGETFSTEAALERARAQREAGASTIDLGAASSHPDARDIPPAEEIGRLEPVIRALHAEGCSLSVDSWKKEVQRFAIKAGVDFLNDVQGFGNPELYPELCDYRGQLIVMHSMHSQGRAARDESSPEKVIEHAFHFFEERLRILLTNGLKQEKLILDPGMGFFLSTDPLASIEMIKKIQEIKNRFGSPVLISVSRKSFLGQLTGRPVDRRQAGTLTAEILATLEGADYIRTHDVAALTDALKILKAWR